MAFRSSIPLLKFLLFIYLFFASAELLIHVVSGKLAQLIQAAIDPDRCHVGREAEDDGDLRRRQTLDVAQIDGLAI